MLRETLTHGRTQSKEGFRFRGVSTSRLEALTDTVFGFSLTLLVVSLEVPKTYVEFEASMYSFLGFIFCAMLLLSLWNRHYTFFLKYGIEDTLTRTTNFILLFILLFYVYPLKYLFNYIGTGLWIEMKLYFGVKSEALTLKLKELRASEMDVEQWASLILNFGMGLLAIEFIYFLWYRNAYRKRVGLQLDTYEVAETKKELNSYVIKLGVPILSILVVMIGGGMASGYAGAVYLLLPILISIHERRWRRRMVKQGIITPAK